MKNELLPSAESVENKQKIISNRIYNSLEQVFPFENMPWADMVQKLPGFEQNFTRAFPEFGADAERVISELKSDNHETTAEGIRALSDAFGTILAEHFSLEEAEERMRENNYRLNPNIHRLNDIFDYTLEGSAEDELFLHVPTLFSEGFELGAQFRPALKDIARVVQSDPRFAAIKTIAGESWIFYNRPKLAELMGFTITDRYDDKRLATGKISKEDFLRRYGK